MIGAFKPLTTNYYIRGVKQQRWPGFYEKLWQRNFYEHIVRSENELEKIRDYIRHNPLRWECDRYNPERGVPVVEEDGRIVPWSQS
jgi:REP element-mobilizing transposase RayT